MIVTIDGRPCVVAPGTTVLTAALANGIDIPCLCHHPALRPGASCRLCLVEVEGAALPQASCSLECGEGMIIRTQSEPLTALRRDIVDLFIAEHPLDCVVCDKSGACRLQHYAYELGVAATSYDFKVARPLRQDDNPFFVRDHQYCILCGLCTRVCDEIIGVNAIEIAGRGFTSQVATPFNGPMIDSSCVFCGNCVQVCPTAALLPVSRLGKGREWAVSRTRSVCSYCGVGCGLEYAVKDGAILYAQGFASAPANGEFLCVKGRFGWDFVTSAERLTQPLIRRDLAYRRGLIDEPWTLPETSVLQQHDRDAFLPIDWTTALEIAADELATTVERYGADAVAGLASARCTNEENYLFQKLMRASLGTNHVDHCARLCHASSVTGLGLAFGSGAMTNPIADIRAADCLLITGSNTAESHPVIGYEVVRAVKGGANLIIIDPRRVPLVEQATLFLQPRPGTDIAIFLAMAHVILREGWADQDFIAARTEGFAAFQASVVEQTPAVAALASGVPAELIERAARWYALGERADGRRAEGAARGDSTILYAMGITQRRNGTELVLALANLAMLTGQIGRPATGVNPLRGQSNVQGACDVGALPNLLPGYRPVTDPAVRAAVADAWAVPALPAQPGLTVVEMMQAAAARRLRAMLIMGENPLLSDPNISHVEAGLRALDCLIVQEIFLSETARLAHLVLPAAAALEKDGTMTNTERRIQTVRPVLSPPGEAWPDWQILSALGQRLDQRRGLTRAATAWDYASTAAIMHELAAVTPIYGGVRHERLGEEGLVWPCPTLDHPGTPILHVAAFSRGRGAFHAVPIQLPAEQPDADYPLILTTGRMLYHYHTGTMTRRSRGLDWREPRGYAEVNAADGAAAGLRDGGPVVVRSRRGAVRTQARFSRRVPPGTVFLSFHWAEAPANLLTQDAVLDPLAKIPEYKVCAVRLERPARGSAATHAGD